MLRCLLRLTRLPIRDRISFRLYRWVHVVYLSLVDRPTIPIIGCSLATTTLPSRNLGEGRQPLGRRQMSSTWRWMSRSGLWRDQLPRFPTSDHRTSDRLALRCRRRCHSTPLFLLKIEYLVLQVISPTKLTFLSFLRWSLLGSLPNQCHFSCGMRRFLTWHASSSFVVVRTLWVWRPVSSVRTSGNRWIASPVLFPLQCTSTCSQKTRCGWDTRKK